MSLEAHQTKVDETFRRIQELNEKRGKLYEELRMSLALKRLWPSIFDHGGAKTRIEGGRLFTRFVMIRGDGVTKTLLLKDVPVEMWYSRLMKEHKQTNMGNWPKVLRDEYMRRRKKK